MLRGNVRTHIPHQNKVLMIINESEKHFVGAICWDNKERREA